MKNKKKILISIVVVIILLVIGMVFFYQNGISSVSSKSEDVIVRIEKGSSPRQILNTLDEAGLVKNKLCGQIFLKFNSYDNLQANSYVLNKNMSLSKMYEIMQGKEYKYILRSELTIKDANTIPEVADAFADILDISSEEVIKQWADEKYLKELIDEYWFIDESILNKDILYPLEGYLYPETYYVTDENPTVQSMTKFALDMMDQKLTPLKSKIEELNWTPHQFLTFVSIVERESGKNLDDKNMIAGVFMNRLNQNMLLQSDITVNYAWQRTGVDVSVSHLQIDSQYNTYKYTGLPVGPISTVLEDTMKRCLDYKHHDYLYFFADENGQVIYSKTYKEHQNVVKENKWY